MTDQADDHVHELWALRERAKELSCIYSVSAALSRRDEPPQVVFRWVLDAIPPAWQYPADTTARIEYLGRTHALPDFIDTPWRLRSPISVWRTSVGAIEVHYKKEKPTAWEGPFLREERELLDNVAHRIGEYLEWKQKGSSAVNGWVLHQSTGAGGNVSQSALLAPLIPPAHSECNRSSSSAARRRETRTSEATSI